MSRKPRLNEPPRYLRVGTKSAPAGVDREARIIRQYAVITRGEAIGHEMWIDSDMLGQVRDAINASAAGIKSRFTHPNLSGDGLGTYLGRTRNAVLDGDTVRADLHISDMANESPDGSLGDYVMGLAEADPEAFGASIVFANDRAAEANYAAANVDEDGDFKSPDAENTKNYTHARLAALHASDIVDEPAANPHGMFRRDPAILTEAESLAAFALGLTTERPKSCALGLDADRAKGFITRFLASHQLELVPMANKQEVPTPETAPVVEPKSDPAVAAASDEFARGQQHELDRFAALADKFKGEPEFIVECMRDKLTVAQAESAFFRRAFERQAAELAALRKEVESRKPGVNPVPFSTPPGGRSDDPTGAALLERARAFQKDNPTLSLTQCMSRCAQKGA